MTSSSITPPDFVLSKDTAPEGSAVKAFVFARPARSGVMRVAFIVRARVPITRHPAQNGRKTHAKLNDKFRGPIRF